MESTTSMKPKTFAEMLPYLSGIVSKDAMLTLTAKKQSRTTIAQTRTAEKSVRPLTIAEMKACIPALKNQSPRRQTQATTSVKKKIWNSSVKVESKKISHTADGQMKHNPVRKVLNFQMKPKNTLAPRMTIVNTEILKFTKPEFRPKKPINLPAKNNVRISGICNIPQTPVISNPARHRMTMANKENLPSIIKQSSLKKVASPKIASPKPAPAKKILTPRIPDTPLSNQSWKSSCDASFLQKEKEIHEIEERIQTVAEEQTLERIAEVSPPVSTPFQNYRNVKEYFNNSSDVENSALYGENTIMCFDNSFQPKDHKQEESDITSLCERLNKASVTKLEKTNTELHDLLEVEKQTEANIKILDKIREQELKSLEYIRKLINEKRKCQIATDNKTDNIMPNADTKDAVEVKVEKISPENTSVCRASVIKSTKSPSYKIPKKSGCLRKKVFYKSMPNVARVSMSPSRDLNDKALSVYMNMKKDMNFLSTPVKERKTTVPDTQSITSHNLQKQLDKLYGNS